MTFHMCVYQRNWPVLCGPTQSKQWRIELFYWGKGAKTSRITVLNIRKLYLYFVYFKLYVYFEWSPVLCEKWCLLFDWNFHWLPQQIWKISLQISKEIWKSYKEIWKFGKFRCKSQRRFRNLTRRFENFFRVSHVFPNYLLKFPNFLCCALSLANNNIPSIAARGT